ncbi:hypothetical protein [Paraburkholderia sp. J7]|uniref:hypothetical protein n=1 Tax=Paraburkholderia sp. J7 TaxID=2805438 RepID=UPI002AB67390|nr:hypothetical protein [Paraburkholderia sp. J7]
MLQKNGSGYARDGEALDTLRTCLRRAARELKGGAGAFAQWWFSRGAIKSPLALLAPRSPVRPLRVSAATLSSDRDSGRAASTKVPVNVRFV